MQFSIHSCWQIKNRNLELWRFSFQFHDFLRIVKVFHFTIFLFRFDDFSYASRKKPSKWLKEIFWRIFNSISRFFIRNLPFHNFLNPPKVLRDFRKLFQSFQSSNWNKKIAKWNTFTMHKNSWNWNENLQSQDSGVLLANKSDLKIAYFQIDIMTSFFIKALFYSNFAYFFQFVAMKGSFVAVLMKNTRTVKVKWGTATRPSWKSTTPTSAPAKVMAVTDLKTSKSPCSPSSAPPSWPLCSNRFDGASTSSLLRSQTLKIKTISNTQSLDVSILLPKKPWLMNDEQVYTISNTRARYRR